MLWNHQAPGEEALAALAELLMMAAYADHEYHGDEAFTILGIVRRASPGGKVTAGLQRRLAMFSPEGFDVADACERIQLRDGAERRRFFALLGQVTDADGELDLRESTFIREVAAALGADPDEIDGLVVEVAEHDEADDAPPPLPTDPPDADP